MSHNPRDDEHAMNAAREWTKTESSKTLLGDVERLGWDGAVDYQMELIRDRLKAGDVRWRGVTRAHMAEALLQFAQEQKWILG